MSSGLIRVVGPVNSEIQSRLLFNLREFLTSWIRAYLLFSSLNAFSGDVGGSTNGVSLVTSTVSLKAETVTYRKVVE